MNETKNEKVRKRRGIVTPIIVAIAMLGAFIYALAGIVGVRGPRPAAVSSAPNATDQPASAVPASAMTVSVVEIKPHPYATLPADTDILIAIDNRSDRLYQMVAVSCVLWIGDRPVIEQGFAVGRIDAGSRVIHEQYIGHKYQADLKATCRLTGMI
jgi:hypothetical protein